MNKIDFFVPDIVIFRIFYESFKIRNNDDNDDELFLWYGGSTTTKGV